MLKYFNNFINSINEAFNIESDFIQKQITDNKNQILQLASKNKTDEIINLLNDSFKDKFDFKSKSKLEIDKNIKELEAEIKYRKGRVAILKNYDVLKQGALNELIRIQDVLAAFKSKKDTKIKILFNTWKRYHKHETMNMFQKISLWFYRKTFNELTFGEYNRSSWLPQVKHYKFGVLMGEYNFVTNELLILFDDNLSKLIKNQSDHFEKFAMLVSDILHHELIHKADMLNLGIREMKARRTNNSWLSYLGEETELEAHSSEAYKQLHRQFDDKEIKTMLNRPLEFKYQKQIETSIAAQKYQSIIYEDPNLYLLFVDKVMDNMEKYYRSENIL